MSLYFHLKKSDLIYFVLFVRYAIVTDQKDILTDPSKLLLYKAIINDFLLYCCWFEIWKVEVESCWLWNHCSWLCNHNLKNVVSYSTVFDLSYSYNLWKFHNKLWNTQWIWSLLKHVKGKSVSIHHWLIYINFIFVKCGNFC